MITHIQMKNFKSWQESPKVELAPLTGFFGTNSSGKSSLLQMLLLLKQTLGTDKILFFGDENSLVNLGSFREVIHGHIEEAVLELELGCRLQNSFTIEMPQQSRYGYPTNYSHTSSLNIDNFTFETAIKESEQQLSVERICYAFGSDNELKAEWTNGRFDYLNQYDRNVNRKGFYHLSRSRYDDSLMCFISSFEKMFTHFYYLGPTRVHPERLYHWEKTHPKEIDLWGDKAVDALLSARVRQLTTNHNGKSISIEEQISKWLQKMELAYSFSLVPSGALDDNNYKVRFQRSPSSVEVTLADMGHGVADLFPLLVHCCYVPEGSTLILEQPGVHLHPKAQADLADLFLEVIKERNLQILIESHSEHFLTRLQRRVAENLINRNDVALYFCENTDGFSTIEQLKVKKSGEIENWPDNFFGDVMGDMFAMTDVQIDGLTEHETED